MNILYIGGNRDGQKEEPTKNIKNFCQLQSPNAKIYSKMISKEIKVTEFSYTLYKVNFQEKDYYFFLENSANPDDLIQHLINGYRII